MAKTIMVRRVPEDIHRKFRMWCFEHDISMNQKVIELMAATIGSTAPPAPQHGGYRPPKKTEAATKSGLALAQKYRAEMGLDAEEAKK